MLRVSEIYNSFQGEGPNTGRPTTFLRFAGCNLKCPGWPCDTQHAIDPKIFTKEQVLYTPDRLAAKVAEHTTHTNHLCLTGGEVFLQGIRGLQSLLQWLQKIHTPLGSLTIEVFTNGTMTIPYDISRGLDTIVLDWKLPGSGENGEVEAVFVNVSHLRPIDAVKFTVKDRQDYEVAKERYGWMRKASIGSVVYCGPVWDHIDAAELAGWMLEDSLPWRLNVQTHKFIWHPDARKT